MSKTDVKELTKKETALIEKYLKLKDEEKKNKENIEAIKEDVIKIVSAHNNKIEYDGRSIIKGKKVTYQYSEAIENIETELKVLKEREQTLQIANVSKTTEYVKVYDPEEEDKE
ncbi:hypothetical protein E6A47_00685 [Brachyspira pilosicoli]|uniref:hypothetical protein n=1 Tax=Brachyspira pilosicoli TaxID=52584 RepID=UPI001CA50D22|nr:hypothetical protein [Brachyspira pilosicoli]MBW5398566.1 hypothetical protein [Brachyspira pilosicoli]